MKKLVDVILITETNHGRNKPGELRSLNKERARVWVEDLHIAKYAKEIPGALSITEKKTGKGSLSLTGKGESNE